MLYSVAGLRCAGVESGRVEDRRVVGSGHAKMRVESGRDEVKSTALIVAVLGSCG